MNSAEQIQKVNEAIREGSIELAFGYSKDRRLFYGRIARNPQAKVKPEVVFGGSFFEALANTLASLVGS